MGNSRIYNTDVNSATGYKIIHFLAALNIASMCFYALEYMNTGEVVTTSGGRVKGYHETPAILGFVAFMYQVYGKKVGGWHATIGKVAIMCAIACLAFVIPNLVPGARKQLVWVDALKNHMGGEHLLLPLVLVWNETVNIHQFMIYALLLLQQLYRGYMCAKGKQFKQHELHMQSAALLLLGPLSQRFPFNHLTDKWDEHAVFWQVLTYSALMLLIDQSVARATLRPTLLLAFVAAVVFVRKEESAMQLIIDWQA